MAQDQDNRPRRSKLRDFATNEYAALIVIALACALFLGFLQLAEAVGEGGTDAFDAAILDMFRVPGNPGEMIGPFWFREAVRDVTALGSFSLLTIITVLVVTLLMLAGQRGPALLVLVSVLGGTFLSEWLKTFFARPRPEYSVIAQELSSSFPSGHAMLSATVFLTIGALLSRFTTLRRLRIFFLGTAIILTVAVGITRVMLGVHFPSDVLAGWALGAAWAMLCSTAAYFLRQRGAF